MRVALSAPIPARFGVNQGRVEYDAGVATYYIGGRHNTYYMGANNNPSPTGGKATREEIIIAIADRIGAMCEGDFTHAGLMAQAEAIYRFMRGGV